MKKTAKIKQVRKFNTAVLLCFFFFSALTLSCSYEDDQETLEKAVEKVVDEISLQSEFHYRLLEGSNCGVIAETSCLEYLGFDISYDDVIEHMGWDAEDPNKTDSTANHDNLLDYYDISHEIKITTIDEIKQSLSDDYPVICLVESGPTSLHWIVMTAWIDENWTVAWGDGESISREISDSAFKEMYRSFSIIYKERRN